MGAVQRQPRPRSQAPAPNGLIAKLMARPQVLLPMVIVAGMLGSPSVHSVVEATISLARALQIRVVAEGVETKEQGEALERLGCDEIQGYFVGAPMAAEDFERWTAGRAFGEGGAMRRAAGGGED